MKKINQNKPTVSVIMPSYNAEKYIAEAIESILKQSFRDFEFIIINDGSKDKTLSIIKNYQKIDNRIKLIEHASNEGLIKSLNDGIKKASGKYIARMDADDISLEDRLLIQVNFLEDNSDIYLVGGSFYCIAENGDIMFTYVNYYNFKTIKRKLPCKSMIHHPTVMFRNEGQIFYRDKALYCEDRDLWLRFLTEGKKMIVLSDIVLKYRLDKNSICNSNPEKQRMIMKEVVKWYFERKKGKVESYSNFNLENIVNKNKFFSLDYYRERTLLEFAFKTGANRQAFRKNLFVFWKNFGFFSWKKSLVAYVTSFLPSSIIMKIRTKF
jgi:glycosyltransferase involved in cell wall biosynthesis